MVTIEFDKQCGCVKRSDYEAISSFETFEEAQKKAQEMCEQMNEKFCLKHNFEVSNEDNDKIIIKMYLREQK